MTETGFRRLFSVKSMRTFRVEISVHQFKVQRFFEPNFRFGLEFELVCKGNDHAVKDNIILPVSDDALTAIFDNYAQANEARQRARNGTHINVHILTLHSQICAFYFSLPSQIIFLPFKPSRTPAVRLDFTDGLGVEQTVFSFSTLSASRPSKATKPSKSLSLGVMNEQLAALGIAYVLNTLKPGEIQIVGSTSPVPAPPAAPAGTTGGTTAAAAAAVEEESDAGSGVPSPHFIAAASGSIADWEKDNNKAMGVIKLHVAQAIGAKIENITTARVMWDTLKDLYGRPGAAEIFQNFKRAMNIEISCNAHPGAAIDLIKMYLTRITNAGDNTEIPMYLQYMIVTNKLPPDIYAYIIAKITQDDIDDFEHETLDNLRTHVVNTWEACGRKKPQSANTTKITAIKRKGKPPVFEEQQQQHHKGSSSAWRGKG
ncbi:hypothetical protein D9758_003478 [Tetrapyrgos nigripes]|uniref:Gag protein n=1 Tax=Tetrapyrgos nigripes TaxID=182062 RepID=A0A8H5GUS2_9AGAR|nr:hypothetical protein D9758_003478 [Tetrapyrgos nigripes]